MLPVPSSDRRNSLFSYLARRRGAFPLTIGAVDWADVSSCPYPRLCHAPATSGEGRRWWVQALSSHRSEEHTSELQSLMRISYAVFCLKKQKHVCHENNTTIRHNPTTSLDLTSKSQKQN